MRVSGWSCLVLLATVASALAAPQRHPAGFPFELPAGWQIRQSEDGLTLVPQAEAADTWLLLAEPSGGVQSPADPSVVRNMDEQIRGLVPFVNLVGDPETTQLPSGPGAVLTWTGRNNQNVEIMVRAFLALLGNQLVTLVGFGPLDGVQGREVEARTIFNSYGGGAAPAPQAPPAAGNPLARPAAGAPQPAASPFAGVFKNEQMSLELRPAGEDCAGTLTLGGQQMPISGQLRGQTLYGTFQSGGATYMFSAKLEGNVLQLTSDGVTHRLERQGGATNPLARPTGPTNPLAGGTPAAPAGSYAGRYVMQSPKGPSTLELRQQGTEISGTLKAADGTLFEVQAGVREGGTGIVGVFSANGAGNYFEAEVVTGGIKVVLMNINRQTEQPDRSSAREMVFKREGGAAATSAPAPLPTAPRPGGAPQPVAAGGGQPLQENRQYAGGTRLSTPAGVSFTVPQGYGGGLPQGGVVVVLASQPISRVALVGVAASAPQPPTIESLASSYFTLLTNPKLLGDNIQLQPAAQPQVNGDTVTLPFVGMNQAGPVAGFAIGKLGPAGNAIIVFTAGGQHEQQVVEALAREIVGSAAFGAPTEDPNQAFRALAGQRLVKTGGSYNKTSPNTSLSQDSQTVIDLGGNGQFAYHYRSMGMVTTPGGMGGHYDTNENKRGTWRIEVYANGTGLLLVPDDGSEIMSFDIGVDGGQLLLNGAPYSRQPLG